MDLPENTTRRRDTRARRILEAANVEEVRAVAADAASFQCGAAATITMPVQVQGTERRVAGARSGRDMMYRYMYRFQQWMGYRAGLC
jgi:hypothetical protein